jgi:hypothetical protein
MLSGREGHRGGAAQQVDLEPGVAVAVAEQDHGRGVSGVGDGQPAACEGAGAGEKFRG